MESQNSSFSDILSNFIIYFLLGILGYIIWGLLFGEKYSGTTSSVFGYAPQKTRIKILKDENVTARDKACVSVGLCIPSGNESLSTEQLYKWKNKIMDDAEKIFGKDKVVKSKKKVKKKK